MSHAAASRLQLLAAAFLFSTGGAAIKGTALTGWQVASFRSLAAAVVLAALFPAARRWSWRVVVAGLGYAGTLIFYVLANKLTTAANAIFLQGTAPLYLLLLAPWLLRERIRRADLILMLVIAAGMALFFTGRQAPTRIAPDPLLGNVLGALSGVCWALTLAGLRWIESGGRAGESGIATVVAGNSLAGLISLPMAVPVVEASAADWLVIAYLGVFQIGLAYICLTRAMRSLPALEASLLMLAEPALNPVWAWLVHGETPGALAIAGGALILAATVLRSMLGGASERKM